MTFAHDEDGLRAPCSALASFEGTRSEHAIHRQDWPHHRRSHGKPALVSRQVRLPLEGQLHPGRERPRKPICPRRRRRLAFMATMNEGSALLTQRMTRQLNRRLRGPRRGPGEARPEVPRGPPPRARERVLAERRGGGRDGPRPAASLVVKRDRERGPLESARRADCHLELAPGQSVWNTAPGAG